MLKKIQSTLKKACATAESLLKTAVMSRPVKRRPVTQRQGTIVILGNGPSLRDAIDNHFPTLMSYDRMALNFAANAPEYFRLKPQYYILADPHFFGGHATDENVRSLWSRLAMTDWPMTLLLPAPAAIPVTLPPNIAVRRFNLTPLEGYTAVTHPLYDRGLGMPRPRNVMIPAIMEAIAEGYRDILLTGADHSWLETLRVDGQNRVVSIQPHFYKDNDREEQRVKETYSQYHLHDILESMTVAFRSYWQIRSYATARGVSIYNCTPGSYIDAFERRTLA